MGKTKENNDMDPSRTTSQLIGSQSEDATSPYIDREFVLRKVADFTEAGNGFLYEFSEKAQHLYLISGEVFSLSETHIARIQ
jgi:hypothetical protein